MTYIKYVTPADIFRQAPCSRNPGPVLCSGRPEAGKGKMCWGLPGRRKPGNKKKDPGQLSPRPLCSVGCRGWLTNPDHKHQSTNVAFILLGGSVTVNLKSPLIRPTSASLEATRSSWSSFSRYPAIPIPSSR